MKHLGDITKIDGYKVPLVDVIVGGSPCQDLSVAGKRKGLDGERSGLFMEQIRIIKEMRYESTEQLRGRGATIDIRQVQPRYMVWENVCGAFSSNKGEDFRCVLEETARIADKTATIPRFEGGWHTSGCIMGDRWSIAWRVHDAQFWGVPQRRKRVALVADFGGATAPEILFERKGVSRDLEAGEQRRQEITRGVRESANPTSYTLKIRGGVEIDSKGKKAGKGALVQTELSATLSVTQDQTLIQTQCFTTQACGDRDNPSQSFIKEKAYTIPANPMSDRGQAVIYSIGHDIRSAGLTDDEKTDPLTATDYKDPIKLNIGSIVRRLTPLECERLQGYPDNWTNIGEWIDSKGKKHKDADSPRYKALGNSIALPFWEWMANRIAKQLDKSATMASLFDGIGGFPLVFSRCGVKPVWASEIEEFPIAVTKIRFPE
jgi:DNA (cytosine-5)-methyltransferase 1